MKRQNLRFGVLFADLLWLTIAIGLAFAARYGPRTDLTQWGSFLGSYGQFTLCATLVWVLLFFEMNLDGFRGGWHVPAILSKLLVGVLASMVVLLALAFATNHRYSRLVLLYFAVLFLLGTIAVRFLARLLVTSQWNHFPENRCIIVGRGPVARELNNKLAAHPEFAFQIVGFLYPGPPDGSNGFTESHSPQLAFKTLDVLELLRHEKIRKVIVATPQPNGAELRKLISECRKLSIQVYLVPDLYDLYLTKVELTEIDGLPLVSLHEQAPPAASPAVKRLFDVVLSLGILLLLSPILFLAALLVYIDKRKAFRTEMRCGKDGVPFRMYRLNIERHGQNTRAYERWFVRWSLTELPQLWNVLRGEMSLVGPRPESPERTKHYSDWQRQRLKVRAGVTGLAQVHGIREQHPSEEKTRFDLQYIAHWSPLLDLSIIVQTVWTVASRGLVQYATPPAESPVDSEQTELLLDEVANANRS